MTIKVKSFKDDNLKENEVEVIIKSPVISEDLNKLYASIVIKNIITVEQKKKVTR